MIHPKKEYLTQHDYDKQVNRLYHLQAVLFN